MYPAISDVHKKNKCILLRYTQSANCKLMDEQKTDRWGNTNLNANSDISPITENCVPVLITVYTKSRSSGIRTTSESVVIKEHVYCFPALPTRWSTHFLILPCDYRAAGLGVKHRPLTSIP